MDEDWRESPEATLRTQAGLCGSCVHMRVLVNDRGSAFAQCGRSFTDPAFPKYPRLPVLQCDGWERREAVTDERCE